jgi:hypothetical protein
MERRRGLPVEAPGNIRRTTKIIQFYTMNQFRSLNVRKYELKEDIVLFDKMLRAKDVIFIQDSDPVSGTAQAVFSEDGTLLGRITSSYYWDIRERYLNIQ